MLNEAAILAARRDKTRIGQLELEEAVERVVSGPERKSHMLSDTEKTLTAYHEAGHALVASCLLNHDPVHKITIIPRGLRVGSTRFLPPEDRAYQTRSQCTDALTSALSGHAAEIVVFGETSTGASDDLERATAIARSMVKQFGMSTGWVRWHLDASSTWRSSAATSVSRRTTRSASGRLLTKRFGA